MRACQPSHDGYVERDGVKVFYEVFGAGEPTVLLLPTWSIIHSRHWKLQVPDMARRHRVITFDGRGNGRSDRPDGPEAYRTTEFTADALAVMDATGTERAVLVALSLGATWALELGALHPERVAGIVFIGPALPLAAGELPGQSDPKVAHSFTERLDTTDGWAKFNQHYWRERYREFLEFFFAKMFTEPHSTKPIEDTVGWGLETDPETLITTRLGSSAHDEPFSDPERAAELATRLRCEAHYDFAGYVTGFDPADPEALRAELGWQPDERVCVVTVGGSGVGEALLRKVIAAYPLAKRAVPELRMIVVAGPRIDPTSLPGHDGLEVRAFVPRLYRQLGACDLAVVQGGLTTCMELVASRRPFLYFPLRNHFEQNFHVAHRLDRHRAGRRMDYAGSDPDVIADAIAAELGRPVDYRPVPSDGAARAATLIAELL